MDRVRGSAAYLMARRRQPYGPVRLLVVCDRRTEAPVDYGLPCDWKAGTAGRLLAGECRLALIDGLNTLAIEYAELMNILSAAAAANAAAAAAQAATAAAAASPANASEPNTATNGVASAVASAPASGLPPFIRITSKPNTGSSAPSTAAVAAAGTSLLDGSVSLDSSFASLSTTGGSGGSSASSSSGGSYDDRNDEASLGFVFGARRPHTYADRSDDKTNGATAGAGAGGGSGPTSGAAATKAAAEREAKLRADKQINFMRNLMVGGHGEIGQRSKMEDSHVAWLAPAYANEIKTVLSVGAAVMKAMQLMAFFGVYDGHGGRSHVDFCAERLHLNVARFLYASSHSATAGAGGSGNSPAPSPVGKPVVSPNSATAAAASTAIPSIAPLPPRAKTAWQSPSATLLALSRQESVEYDRERERDNTPARIAERTAAIDEERSQAEAAAVAPPGSIMSTTTIRSPPGPTPMSAPLTANASTAAAATAAAGSNANSANPLPAGVIGVDSMEFKLDVCQAIRRGCEQTELDWLEYVRAHPSEDSSGAVIAVAIVYGTTLYVANIGDARIVLCRGGKAVDLTTDHKPTLASERARIVRAGGFVDSSGYLNGEIGVARSLGDVDPTTLLKPKGLSSSPDVHGPIPITGEDEFLILACDGLWDVMQSQVAVAQARVSLQRHNDPERTARELITTALKKSDDNVTCMVVGFGKTTPAADANAAAAAAGGGKEHRHHHKHHHSHSRTDSASSTSSGHHHDRKHSTASDNSGGASAIDRDAKDAASGGTSGAAVVVAADTALFGPRRRSSKVGASLHDSLSAFQPKAELPKSQAANNHDRPSSSKHAAASAGTPTSKPSAATTATAAVTGAAKPKYYPPAIRKAMEAKAAAEAAAAAAAATSAAAGGGGTAAAAATNDTAAGSGGGGAMSVSITPATPTAADAKSTATAAATSSPIGGLLAPTPLSIRSPSATDTGSAAPSPSVSPAPPSQSASPSPSSSVDQSPAPPQRKRITLTGMQSLLTSLNRINNG